MALGVPRSIAAVARRALVLTIWSTGLCAQPSYDQLLAQAERGDPTTDFRALRAAFTATAFYDPYDLREMDGRDAMRRAFNAGDCVTTIKQAELILKTDYVDIESHGRAAQCYSMTGNPQQAERHISAVKSLLQSILASGDGKSPQTAYIVISLPEEYELMNAQGLKNGRQSLINSNGHAYDSFDVVKDDGTSGTVFFNIDQIMSWSKRQD